MGLIATGSAPVAAFGVPHKRRRLRIPGACGLLKPGPDLRGAVRVLSVERAALEHALDRLRHVEPTAAHAACVAAGSSDDCGTGSAARIALRCSRSQGCSTALGPRAAGCSRTWPDAGWNRVRILVVPPRMYSCGCWAGRPRGCHDTPECGTAWNGPASSSHQAESPSCAPSV